MRTKQAIKGTIYEIIPMLIISLIGFVKTKVFVTYLGSNLNGYYQFINQFITYLFLAEAGFGTAITYKLYKPTADKDKKKISQIYYGGLQIFKKIGLLISFGILLISIFFTFFINESSILKTIIIISFILISASNTLAFFFYSKMYLALFSARQEVYKSTIITNIIKIICEIITIIVTIKYSSLLLIGIIMFISKVIEEILFYVLYSKNFELEKVNPKEYDKSAYKMTKDLFISQIGYLAFNNIDIIIIMFTKALGSTMVSIYSTYNYIQKFVFSIVAKLSKVILNILGNIYAVENKNKSKKIFDEYLVLNFIIGTICGLCFFIGARGFINIWINESEYILSTIVVITFAFILYLSITMEPLIGVIAANGLFKDSKYYTLISSLINVILSILLVENHGIFGILFATAIAYMFDIFFRCYLIKKIIYNEKKYKIYQQFIVSLIVFISLMATSIKLEVLFFNICTNYLTFGLYIMIVFLAISFITIIIYYLTFKPTKDLILRFKRLIIKLLKK